MRQREHEVEIGHRQQLLSARGKPALARQRLALRTMTVAARVIGVALCPAGIALRKLTAERRGAAGGDRAQRAMLNGGEPALGADGCAVVAHDIGELDSPRAGSCIAVRPMHVHGRGFSAAASLPAVPVAKASAPGADAPHGSSA